MVQKNENDQIEFQVTLKDVGLGTPYERYSVHNYLKRIIEKYHVKNVFEGPTDGMTGIKGINSLPFAQAGIPVTLELPKIQIPYAKQIWENEGCTKQGTFLEFKSEKIDLPANSFDLVWNFNSLPQVKEPSLVIKEMARLSKKYVMIFVSNTVNYGFFIHVLHHKKTGEMWEHGNIKIMNIRKIEKQFHDLGFETIEKVYADAPYWPDIDRPFEYVLGDLIPPIKPLFSKSQSTKKRLAKFNYSGENLPYFNKKRFLEFEKLMKKHGFIEYTKIPFPKFLFAHHRGILLAKKD